MYVLYSVFCVANILPPPQQIGQNTGEICDKYTSVVQNVTVTSIAKLRSNIYALKRHTNKHLCKTILFTPKIKKAPSDRREAIQAEQPEEV